MNKKNKITNIEIAKAFGVSDSDINAIMKSLTPKPDDPNCKTPCSKCLGSHCGCTIIAKRNPKEECGSYEDTLDIEYKDGTRTVISTKKMKGGK